MENNSQILIYQNETGETKLEVRLENETVWLSQKMMADLFQVTIPTVNEHIKNIYSENELPEDSTIRKFRIVQNQGKRKVFHKFYFYNLDMRTSSGYKMYMSRCEFFL